MRLFRRSLLCLVVGVTAFGVAGWMLRPGPMWSIPAAAARRFIEESADLAAGRDVFWMYCDEAADSVFAFDTATGRMLRTVEAPDGFRLRSKRRLPDGGMALVATKPEGTGQNSWVAVFDAASDRPRIEHRVEGRAELVAGSGRFWTIRPDGDKFAFRLADIVSGATLYERRFLNRRGRDRVPHYDVSADGTLLVFATAMQRPNGETPVAELWDVPRGELVRQFHPSDGDPSEASVSQLRFSDRGRFLDVGFIESGKFVRQSFDLQRREIVTQVEREWKPDLPPGSENKMLVERSGHAGETVCMAIPFEGQVSFAVCRGQEVRLPWRGVPVEQVAMTFIYLADSADAAPKVSAMPNDQFLFQLWTPSYAESLPKSLHPYLPRSLQLPDERLFWHDWRRNDWREVGCAGSILDRLVRPDRVVTLSRPRLSDDETPLLQSWPLPPRDPKWPALGIAAACAAGTWWMCAKHNRRRMNRAAIPSVTA